MCRLGEIGNQFREESASYFSEIDNVPTITQSAVCVLTTERERIIFLNCQISSVSQPLNCSDSAVRTTQHDNNSSVLTVWNHSVV